MLLRDIHGKGFLHMDLKPGNILLGGKETGGENKIYLIDYGLATSYLGPTGRHIPEIKCSLFRGNALFASYNIHDHIIPSR